MGDARMNAGSAYTFLVEMTKVITQVEKSVSQTELIMTQFIEKNTPDPFDEDKLFAVRQQILATKEARQALLYDMHATVKRFVLKGIVAKAGGENRSQHRSEPAPARQDVFPRSPSANPDWQMRVLKKLRSEFKLQILSADEKRCEELLSDLQGVEEAIKVAEGRPDMNEEKEDGGVPVVRKLDFGSVDVDAKLSDVKYPSKAVQKAESKVASSPLKNNRVFAKILSPKISNIKLHNTGSPIMLSPKANRSPHPLRERGSLSAEPLRADGPIASHGLLPSPAKRLALGNRHHDPHHRMTGVGIYAGKDPELGDPLLPPPNHKNLRDSLKIAIPGHHKDT